MFKKLILALALFPALALAQTAPTRPPGDNSNAIATTAFVAQGPIISPAPGTLNPAITATQSAAGTTTTNCTTAPNEFPCLNLFYISSDSVNAASPVNALDGWQFSHTYGGSTLQGARQSLDVIANFTAPSSASNTNRNYVPLVSQMNVLAGDGGTGLTPATAKGAFFGANPVVRCTSGAANLLACTGGEVDVVMGGTTATRIGWSIVSWPSGQASFALPSGLGADAAVNIGAAPGTGAVGWGHGILFSNLNGFAPVSSGGCLICTDGTANTVAKGIDLSAYTFTGNAFASPGFNVSSGGNVTAGSSVTVNSVVISGAAPSSVASCTGLGTGGTCALQTSSKNSAGKIVLTTGTAPAGSGSVTLTFSGPLGSHNAECTVLQENGTGVWTNPGVVIGTVTASSYLMNWFNNGGSTALTASSTYVIGYVCLGF